MMQKKKQEKIYKKHYKIITIINTNNDFWLQIIHNRSFKNKNQVHFRQNTAQL